MQVTYTERKTRKLDVGEGLRGLDIHTVTLDLNDVKDLLSLSQEDLAAWLSATHAAMYKAAHR